VEGRGYLAIFVIIPIILCKIGTLGLPQAITHNVAADHGCAVRLYQLIKLPYIIQTILLIALHTTIVMLYIQGKSAEIAFSGYISIMLTPGLLAHQYALALFQGLGKFRIFNIMRILPMAIYSVALLLIFINSEGSLPAITFSWSFLHLSVGLATLFFAIRFIKSNQGTSSSSNHSKGLRINDLLAFGLRGLLGSTSAFYTFRIDQLLIVGILSPAALGVYVVAQAFANLPVLIAQSVAMILYPLTSIAKNNWQRQKKLITHALIFTAISSLIIVTVLILLIPLLLPFLFGNEFSDSVPIAQILLIAALFLSIRRILVEGQRGLGHPMISTYAELSIYPIAFIVMPIILHYFLITGLAMSVVFSQIVALLIAFWFWSKILSQNRNRSAPRHPTI